MDYIFIRFRIRFRVDSTLAYRYVISRRDLISFSFVCCRDRLVLDLHLLTMFKTMCHVFEKGGALNAVL